MEGPRVVEFESFQEQFGLVCLGDHDDVGLDFCELGARRFPEVGRHIAGNVTAEAVKVELAQPVLQHLDHVGREFGVRVVQSGNVGPIRNGRNDISLRVFLIELRVLHEHAVPRGVVGDDVDDDLQAALVRFSDEVFEVVFRAVGRIDAVVILHGIGAADRSLLL